MKKCAPTGFPKFTFPARGGLFSFEFAGFDKYRRRDLCHGSTFAVLSMHSAYLVTKSSRHTSCCVGSLNSSRINVKEYEGHSGLK